LLFISITNPLHTDIITYTFVLYVHFRKQTNSSTHSEKKIIIYVISNYRQKTSSTEKATQSTSIHDLNPAFVLPPAPTDTDTIELELPLPLAPAPIPTLAPSTATSLPTFPRCIRLADPSITLPLTTGTLKSLLSKSHVANNCASGISDLRSLPSPTFPFSPPFSASRSFALFLGDGNANALALVVELGVGGTPPPWPSVVVIEGTGCEFHGAGIPRP